MDYDQWTQSISREVAAFTDNGPKVSNRFLEAYEDELNEEEETATMRGKTQVKNSGLSSTRVGR
jgi:hypothetical protein